MCRKISAIELFTSDKGASKLNLFSGAWLVLPAIFGIGAQTLWKA